jgi:hypothetical protein
VHVFALRRIQQHVQDAVVLQILPDGFGGRKNARMRRRNT